MIFALALAMLAAVLNASGDLAQRRATRDQPDELSGSARLMWNLFRRPIWLAGVVASLLGLCVHVVALSLGELAMVQPVLVLELPLAVLGGSLLFGARLTRRDWCAVGMLAVGLALFVFCLSPTGGAPLQVSGGAWAAGLGTIGVVVAVSAVAGWRARADLRAGLLGAAAGIGYGATAVLFAAAGAAPALGAAAGLGSWQAYASIAVGLTSFYLLQNSLNSGLLVATEPGLTLLNPIVAVTWGLVVFGEQARTGPWLIGSVSGAALLVAGTLILVRSPALQGSTAGPRRTGQVQPA